jgi:hypothetical protein
VNINGKIALQHKHSLSLYAPTCASPALLDLLHSPTSAPLATPHNNTISPTLPPSSPHVFCLPHCPIGTARRPCYLPSCRLSCPCLPTCSALMLSYPPLITWIIITIQQTCQIKLMSIPKITPSQ